MALCFFCGALFIYSCICSPVITALFLPMKTAKPHHNERKRCHIATQKNDSKREQFRMIDIFHAREGERTHDLRLFRGRTFDPQGEKSEGGDTLTSTVGCSNLCA
eukprot:GEMP01098015.1.p1 GENE.GEMP01098015.1~~GEMP01098015.1.p1  ORF type:complete len:105 (-),score=13.17 GEMP01098015.1:96-410(-)